MPSTKASSPFESGSNSDAGPSFPTPESERGSGKKLASVQKTLVYRQACAEAMERSCKNAKISNSFDSQCLFKCPGCGKMFKSWSWMNRHGGKCTELKFPAVVPNIELFLLRAVAHKCNLCNKKILCDSMLIRYHVSSHNLKPSEYRQGFENEQKSTIIRGKQRRNRQFFADVCSDVMDEICKSADVVDAFDSRCTFKCPGCGKTYKSWVSMRPHASKCEKVKTPVSMSNIESYLLKVVAHQCRVCHKKILCDSTVISSHVASHSLRLTEYRQRYEKEEDRASFHKETALKVAKVSPQIGNLCSFACCGINFDGYANLSNHIVRSKQHTERQSYQQLYKRLTKTTIYKCLLCPKLILCDLTLIGRHVRMVHGLKNLEEYSKMSKDTTYEQYETKAKNIVSRRSHKKSVEEKGYDEEVNKVCSDQFDNFASDIPDYPAQRNAVLKPGSIPAHYVTKHMGNLCEFACCQQTFRSYSNLRLHVLKTHGHCRIQFGIDYLTMARYHRCPICDCEILCDNTVVYRHAKTRHKLAAAEYEKIVMANGGNVLKTHWRRYVEARKGDTGKAATFKSLDASDDVFIRPEMLSSESDDSN